MQLQGHKLGFKGQFSATLIGADGEIKEFVDVNQRLRSGEVIRNRLLDNFFIRLINQATPINTLSVRCSTNADPINDTSTTLIGQMTLNSGAWPSSSGLHTNAVIDGSLLKAQSTFTFTFSQGQITGNISKLAINYTGTATAADNEIHAAALVVDNLGNPTSISPAIDEQLILSYTLFMETSIADVVTMVVADFNGTLTNVEITQRWGNLLDIRSYVSSYFNISSNSSLGVWSGTLNAINVNPSSFIGLFSGTSVAFNVGGIAKEVTYNANISQAVGNIAAAFPAGNSSVVKAGFNPPIPKTADDTLSITFRQTFGRLP